MKIVVLTLFPDMITSALGASVIGRAAASGILDLSAVNIRDYAFNKHHSVDDYIYGGGAGMLMQAEPIYQAYQAVLPDFSKKPRVIYTSPQGKLFSQDDAIALSKEDNLVFLCGHYEGVDERVLDEIVDDTYSIGDYVLTGGELPAMVMIDAAARFLPGVLHNEDSAQGDSLTGNLLEYPQYSRPEVWHEKTVPSILLSGDHAKVDAWRRKESVIRTALRRPDLIEGAQLTEEECKLVKKILDNKNSL